jgi:hypothetical protein
LIIKLILVVWICSVKIKNYKLFQKQFWIVRCINIKNWPPIYGTSSLY